MNEIEKLEKLLDEKGIPYKTGAINVGPLLTSDKIRISHNGKNFECVRNYFLGASKLISVFDFDNSAVYTELTANDVLKLIESD